MAATVAPPIRLLPPQKSARMSCLHPVILDGSCHHCGATISGLTLSTISLGYIHRGLEVSVMEMIRLREEEREDLLRKRRLSLVLDLDGTLLHTIGKDKLTSKEIHLWDRAREHSTDLFQNGNSQRLTKLRPGVREFLREARKMYQMYVCTKGQAAYAETMVGILDPRNKYFKSGVIAREHMPDKDTKTLDVVPSPENMVVIVDDNLEVWPDHSLNLIVPEKYCYFAGRSTTPSLAESGQDESGLVLRSVLAKLTLIHKMFFRIGQRTTPRDRDVRDVLNFLKRT